MGGLIIRTLAKIWAVSASCLAPAAMRVLFRRALFELLLMNLARTYGRAGKWRRWKSIIGLAMVVMGGGARRNEGTKGGGVVASGGWGTVCIFMILTNNVIKLFCLL